MYLHILINNPDPDQRAFIDSLQQAQLRGDA